MLLSNLVSDTLKELRQPTSVLERTFVQRFETSIIFNITCSQFYELFVEGIVPINASSKRAAADTAAATTMRPAKAQAIDPSEIDDNESSSAGSNSSSSELAPEPQPAAIDEEEAGDDEDDDDDTVPLLADRTQRRPVMRLERSRRLVHLVSVAATRERWALLFERLYSGDERLRAAAWPSAYQAAFLRLMGTIYLRNVETSTSALENLRALMEEFVAPPRDASWITALSRVMGTHWVNPFINVAAVESYWIKHNKLRTASVTYGLQRIGVLVKPDPWSLSLFDIMTTMESKQRFLRQCRTLLKPSQLESIDATWLILLDIIHSQRLLTYLHRSDVPIEFEETSLPHQMFLLAQLSLPTNVTPAQHLRKYVFTLVQRRTSLLAEAKELIRFRHSQLTDGGGGVGAGGADMVQKQFDAYHQLAVQAIACGSELSEGVSKFKPHQRHFSFQLRQVISGCRVFPAQLIYELMACGQWLLAARVAVLCENTVSGTVVCRHLHSSCYVSVAKSLRLFYTMMGESISLGCLVSPMDADTCLLVMAYPHYAAFVRFQQFHFITQQRVRNVLRDRYDDLHTMLLALLAGKDVDMACGWVNVLLRLMTVRATDNPVTAEWIVSTQRHTHYRRIVNLLYHLFNDVEDMLNFFEQCAKEVHPAEVFQNKAGTWTGLATPPRSQNPHPYYGLTAYLSHTPRFVSLSLMRDVQWALRQAGVVPSFRQNMFAEVHQTACISEDDANFYQHVDNWMSATIERTRTGQSCELTLPKGFHGTIQPTLASTYRVTYDCPYDIKQNEYTYANIWYELCQESVILPRDLRRRMFFGVWTTELSIVFPSRQFATGVPRFSHFIEWINAHMSGFTVVTPRGGGIGGVAATADIIIEDDDADASYEDISEEGGGDDDDAPMESSDSVEYNMSPSALADFMTTVHSFSGILPAHVARQVHNEVTSTIPPGEAAEQLPPIPMTRRRAAASTLPQASLPPKKRTGKKDDSDANVSKTPSLAGIPYLHPFFSLYSRSEWLPASAIEPHLWERSVRLLPIYNLRALSLVMALFSWLREGILFPLPKNVAELHTAGLAPQAPVPATRFSLVAYRRTGMQNRYARQVFYLAADRTKAMFQQHASSHRAPPEFEVQIRSAGSVLIGYDGMLCFEDDAMSAAGSCGSVMCATDYRFMQVASQMSVREGAGVMDRFYNEHLSLVPTAAPLATEDSKFYEYRRTTLAKKEMKVLVKKASDIRTALAANATVDASYLEPMFRTHRLFWCSLWDSSHTLASAIQELVLARLSEADVARCRLVCRQWACALAAQ